MSMRRKYVEILSSVFSARAVGVSLLLALATAAEGKENPPDVRLSAADRPPVSERLAALRDAVSEIVGPAAEAEAGTQRLAWGNWWRNGGWRNGGWRNWRNGWGNGGWRNWWHNW
jgi:hypothetical protein